MDKRNTIGTPGRSSPASVVSAAALLLVECSDRAWVRRPFSGGQFVVFLAALVMTLIGALASALRGRPPVVEPVESVPDGSPPC